jgi:hypothetical protein
MKGLAYFTGALFSSLTILGLLFKIMHWPGANVTLVLGMMGSAIIFIPLFTIYKFRKSS